MTLDELPLMLTVDEAAEVLRIGRNGAYAAVADGAIPSVRIGRVIRIPRHALAALLGLDSPTGIGHEAAPDENVTRSSPELGAEPLRERWVNKASAGHQ